MTREQLVSEVTAFLPTFEGGDRLLTPCSQEPTLNDAAWAPRSFSQVGRRRCSGQRSSAAQKQEH